MSWGSKTWQFGAKLLAAELNQYLRDPLNFLKVNICLEEPAGLAIVSGSVTKSQTHHVIAAESGTTDDLETINGGADGEVLFLRADDGHTITLKHAVDNIYNPLGEDVIITDSSYAVLLHNGTNQIVFASGLSVAGIQALIDASITSHSEAEDPHGDRGYADSNFLNKENAVEFVPDGDYEPATKKYVDDHAGSGNSAESLAFAVIMGG